MMRHLFRSRCTAALVVLSCVVAVSGCGQHQSRASSAPTASAQKTAAASPVPVLLNTEETGTTADLSKLSERLAGIFRERKRNYAYKPGTTEVEETVFIKADDSLKLGDVIKVMKAVQDAGASPTSLPIEVDFDKAPNIKPNPLTLVVTIGQPPRSDAEHFREIVGGIEIGLAPLTIKRSEIESPQKGGMDAEITKDGAYLVGEQPTDNARLRDALKAILRQPNHRKSVNVLVGNQSETAYGSFAAFARAAFDAGAEELTLFTTSPEA